MRANGKILAALLLAVACASSVFCFGKQDEKKETKDAPVLIRPNTSAQAEFSYAPASVNEVSLLGVALSYDSEPHAWIGFSPENSSFVYYIAPSEAARDMRSFQGRLLSVTGHIEESSDGNRMPGTGDASFIVTSWKTIE